MNKVKTTMTHSKQRAFKKKTPDSKTTDFGLNSTIQSILNTHKISGIENLLSAENPRVLWCADSERGNLCKKAKIVPSTEGFSLGFTDVNQSTVLVDNKRNQNYNKNFLDKTVTVYVKSFKVELPSFLNFISSPEFGDINSSTKSLFLILQDSLAAKKRQKYKDHDTNVSPKISIQDERQFPSLQRNVVNLDTGYFHHILVSNVSTSLEIGIDLSTK